MIFLTVIFVAITAFLIGLSVGEKDVPIKVAKKNSEPMQDSERLKKEYENFLNYDGSVQE